MRLQGKVALVTGAGRGIGRGIAQVFADEGASVAVNDVLTDGGAEETAEYVRSKGGRALSVAADVSKRSEVEAMVERVWRELGPIDILVNNAGIETIIPFLELTDEQWTRLTDVNLRGAWLCSQVFVAVPSPRSAPAASSISDQSRLPRCCLAVRTTRRRSWVSRR